MSTQRPFFGNFFAIFRSHAPHISSATTSVASASVSSVSTPQSLWATAAAASLSKQLSHGSDKQVTGPRPINAKAAPYNAQTTAVQDRQLQNSLAPLQHNVSPQTHLPRTPSSGSLTTYGPPNRPQPCYPTLQEAKRARRTRRVSDSSSDGGFRDVRHGGEKWFIGGITSSGEEKYYKLGMVRRERSADRISADQLSL